MSRNENRIASFLAAVFFAFGTVAIIGVILGWDYSMASVGRFLLLVITASYYHLLRRHFFNEDTDV